MPAFSQIGVEAVVKGMGEFVKDLGRMGSATEAAGKGAGGLSVKSIALGTALGNLATTAGGLLVDGFKSLAGAIGGMVNDAVQAQAIEAQLDQVLLSTGGAAGMAKQEILDLATALSVVTPYEDDLIVQTETLLLQFKNIGEDVFPQATEMALDLAQRLGIDTASAAKLLGKALEEPGEGLLRLKQAGVAFTEEQEAMIQKMVESGDAAGAQKYIMDQLATSVGGAARAAGETFAGKLEILKNQFGNVKEQIGAAFLPALTAVADKLVQVFNDPRVQQGIQELADWLAVNLPIAIEAVVAFIEDPLLPAIKAVAGFIRDPLIPTIKTIYTWLATNIPKAIGAMGEAFTWVKSNVLDPVAQAFEAIAGAIGWVIDQIEKVIEWFKKLGDIDLGPFTPGSPTPLELGLRGINAALKDLARTGMPQFAVMMAGMAPPVMAPAGARAGGGNTYGGDSYNFNVQSAEAWAMAQAWVDNRRAARLSAGMGG